MNLNDFEKHINQVILDRGYDYHEESRVVELHQKKIGEWHAKVGGTELYRVKVSLKNNLIISSRCSCPYDMGPICKHEVAVYYSLRAQLSDESGGTTSHETQEEVIERLLKRMNKEELKSIIKHQALEDDRFYNSLIARLESPGKAKSREYYKKIVRASLTTAMDRRGFIDYYHASDSVEGVYQLLEDARTAIDNGKHDLAVPMCQAVIEVMPGASEYMDDSGGEIMCTLEDAFDLLERALQEGLSRKARDDMFEYCLGESEKSIYTDYGDWQFHFLDLALTAADSHKQFEKLLKKIDDLIRIERDKKHISSYSIEKLLMMKYNLLRNNGNSKEAETVFIENLSLPSFRRLALLEAYKKKQYDRVIELAHDGEKHDGREKHRGLIREWKEWRYKAYKLKKDRTEVRKLSYEFIVDESKIEYYDDYKKSVDQSAWEKTYAKLKNELYARTGKYFSTILADILVKENELAELLANLKKHPSHVEKYQKHFLKSHPGDIYVLHMINIREEAKRADNRKHYKQVCSRILSLNKIGGVKEAKVLLEEFSNAYNRRPAFLNELSKVSLK